MMALLMVTGTAFALSAQDKKDNKAKTETAVYDVALHCANCQAKVEKHIPFEKGVKDVMVDLSGKVVTVKFDPRKTDRETLRKAIEKLGYATTLRAETKAK